MEIGSEKAQSSPVGGRQKSKSARRRNRKPRSKNNTDMSLFLQQPDDVLFAIFSKCDIQTLGRLCQVCRKLNTLIQLDSVWLTRVEKLDLLLIGSSCQVSSCSNSPIPGRDKNSSLIEKPGLKEQCRLSHNWEEKKFKERVLLRINPRQLPWLQYVDGRMWCSMNNTIKCYSIHNDGGLREDVKRKLVLQEGGCHRKSLVPYGDNPQYPNLLSEDVSRFVVKGNLAVSGCRDGSVYIFDSERSECLEKLHRVHSTDTQAVDIHDSCIISGSRDSTIKILTMGDVDKQTEVQMSINMQDRVWSAGFSPDGMRFAVGTSGCKGSLPLTVYDTHSGQFLFSLGKLRYGAGILDIKFEDDNTLLACGYEACLKLWDLRSRQCVRAWQEQFDSTLYCVQSDRNNAIVTGTARYGMLRLWDKRKSESVQEYFMSQKSPVYSVAFDSQNLYAALDSSVRMMKFSVYH